MGLAGPKNKIKISHDPNNTRWTNDTQSFGHKIMASQGWQPGQYLGAKDASHAEFHTAANASHIRVSIKDDNLGLGAKVGSGVGHGECTGLDAFKNLLGRLNGKEEDEIEKEQKARDDLRVAIYTERKWGATRFVSGGFLIGDKIQHLIDAEAERIRGLALGSSSESSSSSESEEEAEPKEKSKKSKKRKIEVLEEEHEEPELVVVKVKKSKKERKVEAATEATQEREELSEKKRSKNSKKDRKSKTETNDTPDAAELKRRRKQEKREKKERKENARAEAGVAEEEPQKKKKSRKDKTKAVETPDFSDASQSTTKESAPATPLTAESGRSTPIMMQGRHAVRARNIAQKRMASMDVASLNQIFMIKT
ncbi:related to Protein pxr1 [Phialocephala subalpina]|uniref:PinX1-related protein 1 n=1 Tax=Phialocephala subalpina TaxID=576137 RepID=A0A1L7WEB1_9HELO|nr:related to Protein pxr1 [Phialocephala subalpina]